MTQKRRIIYMADEAWDALREMAQGRSLTMSEVLRQELALSAPGLGECVYCGEPATEWDHVIPLTKGGADDASNLVLACRPCNRSKSDRTPEEWIDGISTRVRTRNGRSIYIADEQWAALAEIAKREDRSVANLIRQAVGEFLMKHQDWATYKRNPDGSAEIVDEHEAEPVLVPEPLGPDVRTTDEPVLPALKRIEGGTFHPTKPKP